MSGKDYGMQEFLPPEEEILAAAKVQAGTKKAHRGERHFKLGLCLTVKDNSRVYLHRVLTGTNGKLEATFPLSSIKMVDGKDKASLEVIFNVDDSTLRFVCKNNQDKYRLIYGLLKAGEDYGPMPRMQNLDFQLIAEMRYRDQEEEENQEAALLAAAEAAVDDIDGGGFPTMKEDDELVLDMEAAGTAVGRYLEITERQEKDMLDMLARYPWALQDAEGLANRMTEELNTLDGANIYSIIDAEQAIEQLIDKIAANELEVDNLSEQIGAWSNVLTGVKREIGQLGTHGNMLEVQSDNALSLLADLTKLVKACDQDYEIISSLSDPDFRDLDSLTAKAWKLHALMNPDLPPGMQFMDAYQECVANYEAIRESFATKLVTVVSAKFETFEIQVVRTADDLDISKHEQYQKQLAPFTKLMAWLSVTDPSKLKELRQAYKRVRSGHFKRLMKEFMDIARGNLSKVGYVERESRMEIPYFSPEYPEGQVEVTKIYERTFNRALSTAALFCVQEQDFVLSFFQFLKPEETENGETEGKDGEVPVNGAGGPTISMPTTDDGSMSHTVPVGVDNSASGTNQQHLAGERELRHLLTELMSGISEEIVSLIERGIRIDPFNLIVTIVLLNEAMEQKGDRALFINSVLGRAQILAKRQFDQFIRVQTAYIAEAKPTNRKKPGILHPVRRLADFLGVCEGITQKKAQKITTIEKAYIDIMRSIFLMLDNVPWDCKHPDVVRLENFHYLYSQLGFLKIVPLDPFRKQCQTLYRQSLSSYVTSMLGRPMEKVSRFFDGVSALIEDGLEPSEVAFRMAFSKQELRKVIKEYHAKEVRRGLQYIYRELDKHLTEEEGLLQVVWRSMQEEFLDQYKTFQKLIGQCYPGSQITLEVSIDDILNAFSDIARSH
eukprot:Clim_evm10s238 gene=Clim_evmTU10s238